MGIIYILAIFHIILHIYDFIVLICIKYGNYKHILYIGNIWRFVSIGFIWLKKFLFPEDEVNLNLSIVDVLLGQKEVDVELRVMGIFIIVCVLMVIFYIVILTF